MTRLHCSSKEISNSYLYSSNIVATITYSSSFFFLFFYFFLKPLQIFLICLYLPQWLQANFHLNHDLPLDLPCPLRPVLTKAYEYLTHIFESSLPIMHVLQSYYTIWSKVTKKDHQCLLIILQRTQVR